MTNGAGDAAFLSEFPSVISWLGFNPGESNPFLVPPEIYSEVCSDFELFNYGCT